MKPLFKAENKDRMRLVKAACLLHDVSWRAHPDYRAETCFDNATRANLGGLKHSERVFLGLALLHRYRNKREGTRFADLYDLLSEDDKKQAEILGKAMRFGAMLWMDAGTDLGKLSYKESKNELRLQIPESARALYGEVAEARLRSLGDALDAELVVSFS